VDELEAKLDRLTNGIQELDEKDQIYMETLTASLISRHSPDIPGDTTQIKPIPEKNSIE
jgi:hypothetical protein